MRFGNDKSNQNPYIKNLISILVFLMILLLFLHLVSVMSTSNIKQQKESLEHAIDRCVVSCYALEGSYPPSLEYMKEHYGLTYDEDSFFVDYQSIGSNLPPDVTVIIR